MKSRIALLLSLLLASPVTFAAAGDSGVVATVNGTGITEATLQRYAQQRKMPAAGPQRKRLIDELINRELLYQDAVSIGLDKTSQIKAEIEYVKTNIIASAMLNRSSDRFQVSDAELKKEYDARKAELGGKELKARHILLKTEADAKAVIAELDKGADFAKLAGKRSTGPTAVKGGDLGWFRPAQMDPTFAKATVKLKKGSYTETPVKTQFGWHVIKLEDSRAVQPPPFDSIKEQIRAGLQNQLIEKYIGELRSKAKISQP
jgi:peptidyl-prolyl cis-trans isomerase C